MLNMTTLVADAKTANFTTRDLRLQSGEVLPEVTIAYRTVGTLSPKRDNVVLVTHGYTSGPNMIDPNSLAGEGAWNEIVGPGKAIDTVRYFAICPNMLGSSYGSTNAASIDPRTGKRYGPRFPAITVSDIVATQRRLLDHLGIDKMVAIVGPSFGGFQAFQWAVNYPDAMRGIAAIVTAPALPPERSDANVANLTGVLSKNPNWNGGDYYDRGGVLESLIQIRSATLKTYGIEARLRDTMSDPAQIEAAIREEATRWAHGFDANSLLILARALRSFDVTSELPKIKAKVLYVLSRTDCAEGGRPRCGLLPARQRIRPHRSGTRLGEMGAAAAGIHGESGLIRHCEERSPGERSDTRGPACRCAHAGYWIASIRRNDEN
jgi:homoserine O-acetyltransferase/O-succinyltransferase